MGNMGIPMGTWAWVSVGMGMGQPKIPMGYPCICLEMRDKIRSSSAESKDKAGSDPKVDEPLSKGALEEAGLEREGD